MEKTVLKRKRRLKSTKSASRFTSPYVEGYIDALNELSNYFKKQKIVCTHSPQQDLLTQIGTILRSRIREAEKRLQ